MCNFTGGFRRSLISPVIPRLAVCYCYGWISQIPDFTRNSSPWPPQNYGFFPTKHKITRKRLHNRRFYYGCFSSFGHFTRKAILSLLPHALHLDMRDAVLHKLLRHDAEALLRVVPGRIRLSVQIDFLRSKIMKREMHSGVQ